MSDSLENQDRIDSLVREIAFEKSKARPDKKKLKQYCREIERIRGGYTPQASSADWRKPSGEDPAFSSNCAFADGGLVVEVQPPSADDHDKALGLHHPEPATEQEQEQAAQLDAGRLLRRVLIFFLSTKEPSQIGKRVLVFAHHLAPDLMTTTTASDLAKELGYTKAEISRLGTVLHKTLNVRSVRLRSDKARANMRAAALDAEANEDNETSPIDADTDEYINPLERDDLDHNESNA